MADETSNTRSDEELVADLRAGNADAGQELVRRYWQPIVRFCRSYLEDEARAEDVAQDVLAIARPGGALPDGRLKPWLYKIARNRCLDILRRYQISPTHHRPLRTGFDAPGSSAGPHTRAVREERQELIRGIVAAMPEDYRSVLTLKHVEGVSRAEIAEILGITEIAVKGRLVRASDYLRDELRKFTGSVP